MKKMKKIDFIARAKSEALALMKSEDRRRRLDGRLQLATIETVQDLLPEEVKFLETSKNGIRQDYFALNSKYKNLHIFNNNTIYIQQYDDIYKYTSIVVIKATCKNVYRVLTSEVVNKRLTLAELLKVPSLKEYKTIKESLGL